MESWYIGKGVLAQTKYDEVFGNRPTQITFTTDNPKRELVEQVVNDHLLDKTGIHFDSINYHGDNEHTAMPATFTTRQHIRDGFKALTEPGTSFIKYVTDTEINVIYVRVSELSGKQTFFSIVVNRWHNNVSSMFGEKKQLDSTKDTIDFLPESIGAYPNFFIDVKMADIADLFDLLENFDDSPKYVGKLNKYGINRGDPRFWEVYDVFQQRMNQRDPVHAGLYDLNRYLSKTSND